MNFIIQIFKRVLRLKSITPKHWVSVEIEDKNFINWMQDEARNFLEKQTFKSRQIFLYEWLNARIFTALLLHSFVSC